MQRLRDVDAFMIHVPKCPPLSLSEFRLLVAEALQRHHAARTIQAYWHVAIACPDYKICKNRLLTELNEECARPHTCRHAAQQGHTT